MAWLSYDHQKTVVACREVLFQNRKFLLHTADSAVVAVMLTVVVGPDEKRALLVGRRASFAGTDSVRMEKIVVVGR